MDADPPALAPGLLPGAGPLTLAATLLTARLLRSDPADPLWPDRDRLLTTAPAIAGGAALAPALALPTALGYALAERLLAARFGRSLVDHRSWLLLAAEDLASGAAQEAAAAAGALALDRLTVLAATPPDAAGALARFTALGWTLRRAWAHDAREVEAALSAALRSHRPTLIALLSDPDSAPSPIAPAAAPEASSRGATARRAWLRRLHRHALREAFERAVAGPLPPLGLGDVPLPDPATPTEAAARDLLARLAPLFPELAYLPPIQVQALAGAMNGMALHRGLLPIGAAPLSAAEPIGPALRHAATAGLRTLHLITEPDTPCPAGGQRAAWRAMANLHVNRPAGPAELRACLEIALRRSEGPSLLLLSSAPPDPAPDPDPELRAGCARGAYLAAGPAQNRDLTLIASGAELAAAREAAARLAQFGLRAALVSLPCWERFAAQPPDWREGLLGPAPRLGVEAGSGFGWERWLGHSGRFLGCGPDGTILPEIIEQVARDLASGRDLPAKSALRALASAGRFR